MTARDQRVLIARAVEGGAFAAALDAWKNAPDNVDDPWTPCAEEIEIAARLVDEFEEFLAEPLADVRDAFGEAIATFEFVVYRVQRPVARGIQARFDGFIDLLVAEAERLRTARRRTL